MNEIDVLLSEFDRKTCEAMYLYLQNGECQDEGAEARLAAARAAVTDYVAALEAELAALNALMPCGHPQRYAVDEFGVMNQCAICDGDNWKQLAIDAASTIQGDQWEIEELKRRAAQP